MDNTPTIDWNKVVEVCDEICRILAEHKLTINEASVAFGQVIIEQTKLATEEGRLYEHASAGGSHHA